MTCSAFDTFSSPLRSSGDKLACWQDSLVSVCLSHIRFNNWHVWAINLANLKVPTLQLSKKKINKPKRNKVKKQPLRVPYKHFYKIIGITKQIFEQTQAKNNQRLKRIHNMLELQQL